VCFFPKPQQIQAPAMEKSPDQGQLDGLLKDRQGALAAGGPAGTVLTSPLGVVNQTQRAAPSLLGA
jgi:hypothetical protein